MLEPILKIGAMKFLPKLLCLCLFFSYFTHSAVAFYVRLCSRTFLFTFLFILEFCYSRILQDQPLLSIHVPSTNLYFIDNIHNKYYPTPCPRNVPSDTVTMNKEGTAP